ncbi:methyltransferase [Rufibacter tibetensis]|uniref:Uncharacterized protein n=1 Tax=Rufibacter tibetensis TaxID=512763 RepID=A0A0P0CNH2_9BACT|nr:methyltransferase [Rufibacter tibetensis]ALI98678.1 hypothetical protein DC20_06480 [Rufibacter tibetensis]
MDASLSTSSNPFDTLAQLAGGYCVARCLHVVAGIGLADHLEETPRSAEELAAELQVHPEALARMMRLLAAHGVFEVHEGAFKHSAASRLLRQDHPQSLKAFAKMFGLPVFWQIFEGLEHSLQTGRPAAEKVIPEGLWDYFGTHAEENRIFNAAMTSKSFGQAAGVMAAYDFSGFETIGDIGGGRGHLLAAVLQKAPNAKGILFDLPNVVEDASELASDRLELQAGNFFKDPLPACDGYLLMEIIHDWADEEAVKILKAIRQSAPEGAKLLVIEQLISPDQGPHWSKMLDIHMLALLGGRQRSLPEYQHLFEQSGFRLARMVPTVADVSILEAVPV